MDEESLTIEEAAAILGLSVATVRRRCASGEIKARKVGRSWIVDGRALPKPVRRSTPRRSGLTSTLLDFETSIRHLKGQDLRNDVWVPDVLMHEDDLEHPESLILAAADRVDGAALHEPATVVPVPKSPFFPRNAANLSLTDRLAYHAVVLHATPIIDAQLSDSVFSARATEDGKELLKSGRDGWLAWRRAVIAELGVDSPYMVATDITAFFDFVKHELLLPELRDAGVDHRIVDSLRRMLREWASSPNTGIPQGPDVSRVLGNFYMGAVDHVMDGVEHVHYFRFMDDIRIVGSSRAEVIAALQTLDQECRRRGLALSSKKTELHHGVEAVESLAEAELDAVQYAFDARDDDDESLRRELASIFTRAMQDDGTVKTRWARFSLSRLFRLRDRSVLDRVLGSLENLAPLGDLVPRYLFPWMRQDRVQRRITAYLLDKERNTTDYLSTWLLAAMLDMPDDVPGEWVAYARSVALDRARPTFHRAIAINCLALGRQGRDVDAIRDLVRHEHDPEIVRAALTALLRVNRLSRDVVASSRRHPGLADTVEYLRGRAELPSLIFGTRRVSIVSGG